MNTSHLFDFILAEFEIACESRTKSQQLMRLNQWLLERYRAGEAQIVEVTESQSTLSAQRAALSQALFDYHVALARLRLVTGQ